MVFCGTIWP